MKRKKRNKDFVHIHIQKTIIMKGKNDFKHKYHVPTDETYIDNINPVTGVKLNYDRAMCTDREINQLCIDVRLSEVEKFQLLILEGEKIQKWAMLENLSIYARSPENAEKIFKILVKNYQQLVDFLPIMGDGLNTYLSHFTPMQEYSHILNLIYQIVHRTLVQHPLLVEDWIQPYEMLVKLNVINLEESLQHINGSFTVNSLPERRRVALMMMDVLFQYSPEVRKLSKSKVLFFNHDQNWKTRETICKIMKKLLQEDHNNDQLWKSVWEYYHDKESNVRIQAFQTLTNIYYEKNFISIFQQLENEEDTSLILTGLSSVLETFEQSIKMNKRVKVQIVSFCNRIFRTKDINNSITILVLFENILKNCLGEITIGEQVNFSQAQFTNPKIIPFFCTLSNSMENLQLKEEIKLLVYKGLKQSKYEISDSIEDFCEMLDLKIQEQVTVYYLVGQKLLQHSKWKMLETYLAYLKKIRVYKTQYERMCLLIMKIWVICPSFLIEKVIDCVIFLILSNRRSLQFIITIKEKLLNSKSWMHRKNYIIFYSQVKKKCSFDLNKLIPPLVYKNITNQKGIGLKLAFLEVAPQILKYLDPIAGGQKNMAKQCVEKLTEDKDKFVRQKAVQVQRRIQSQEKDGNWIQKLYERNTTLSEHQSQVQQIVSDPKRTVKTQNEIKKSFSRKRPINEVRKKTLNIYQQQNSKKEVSLDLSQYPKINDAKKVNLFRCHSVKIKMPTKKN